MKKVIHEDRQEDSSSDRMDAYDEFFHDLENEKEDEVTKIPPRKSDTTSMMTSSLVRSSMLKIYPYPLISQSKTRTNMTQSLIRRKSNP